jgi:hypothetical protein
MVSDGLDVCYSIPFQTFDGEDPSTAIIPFFVLMVMMFTTTVLLYRYFRKRGLL